MKKFATLIIILVILIPSIFFGALLLVLSKPHYYQEEVQKQFLSNTGLNLEFEQINWQYWPPVALRVSDVRIENPETRDKIARLSSAAIDLDLLSLLFGDTAIQVRGITVDQLELHLITDVYGNRNWINIDDSHEKSDPAENKVTPSPAQEGVLNVMPLGISQLKISQSIIHYEDHGADRDLTLLVRNFSTSSVGYDEPFSLNFDFNLREEKQQAELDIVGNIDFLLESASQNVNLTSVLADGNLTLYGSDSLPVKLSGGMILNVTKDIIRTENLVVSLADMVVETDLTFTDVIKAPSGVNGKIYVAPFNPKELLKNLSLADLQFTREDAFERLSISMTMKSDFTRFETKDLILKLDGSTINGSFRPSFLKRPIINLSLDIDRINLSDYVPPSDSATSPATRAESSSSRDTDVVLIPRDLVTMYTINAHVLFKKVTWEGIEALDTKVHLSTASNKLKTSMEGKLYGGSFDLEFADNPDDLETSGYARARLSGVDITGLTGFDWITGSLDLKSHLEFSGFMQNQVLNSMNGPSSFRVWDGTLDVTPIKSVAKVIDTLQGKTSSISQWPDKVAFKEMEGHHQFNRSQESQLFDMVVDNLRVDGRGGFNIQEDWMDYDISAVIRESKHGQFKVSSDLAGVRWPIKCKGKISESPMDICKADSRSIKKLIGDMAKEQLRERTKDKIKDRARDALKGLFN